jgi:hypothetical protein
MTGGIGFSRQGSDSFKSNRSLLGKRRFMKDSPYYGNKKIDRNKIQNFEELKKWKIKSDAQHKKQKIIIYSIIGILIVSVLIFFFLVN